MNGGLKDALEVVKDTQTFIKLNHNIFYFFASLFTSSYPCKGRESTVCGSNFQNGDFDGLSLCLFKNKLPQKHQIWYSTFLSHICYLKLFIKIGQKLCV